MSKEGGGWGQQKALASGYYTKGPDMTLGAGCDHLVIIMNLRNPLLADKGQYYQVMKDVIPIPLIPGVPSWALKY